MNTRDMRSNIWSLLMCASDQEIHEGMHFYEGANGLCRLLSSIYGVTIESVCGLYAALSPLNTWDTNVDNVIHILRHVIRSEPFIGVNTTHRNRDKAFRIIKGEDPLSVLRGDKVRSFYRAMVDPSNVDHYPIDRHLINAALGTKVTKNTELRGIVTPNYQKVESVYRDLGKREGIGNRLASIIWFVQRRVERGQMVIYDTSSPICCGIPPHSHGKRLRCPVCGRTRSRYMSSVRSKYPLPPIILTDSGNVRDLLPLSRDERGYIRLHSSPYSNSWGWQYLARHEVMVRTGEILRKDEHVHHSNGLLWDCRTDNLEVWLEENHGRHHANHQLLYMVRDVGGRFTKSEVPSYSEQLKEIEECPF